MDQIRLTLAQVNNLSSSLAIVSYYFFDMIYTWLDELEQLIIAFKKKEIILIVFSCFVTPLLYNITI
jgi:hypothetical protein